MSDRSGASSYAADAIFEIADELNLRFVPTARTADIAAQRESAARAADATGTGLGLRVLLAGTVPPPRRTFAEHIVELAEHSGLPPEKTDLLLDLGFIDRGARWSVDRLERLLTDLLEPQWRGAVLLGTSIPKSLSDHVSEGCSALIPRHEWALWLALQDRGMSRDIAFGDYGIQNPEPPPRKTGGRGLWANIRYTVSSGHRVDRGFNVRDDSHGYGQYYDLSEELAESDDFEGPSFSWGDRQIDLCASRKQLVKSHTDWRAIGTSHHLEFVRKQLDVKFGNLRAAGSPTKPLTAA